MEVFENLKANLVGKNARIVLPEGEEPRILQATKRLVKETEVTPVLLGNPDKIRIYLEIEGVLDGYEVIDPHSYQNSSKCQTDFWCLPYGTWIRTLLVRGLCHQHQSRC